MFFKLYARRRIPRMIFKLELKRRMVLISNMASGLWREFFRCEAFEQQDLITIEECKAMHWQIYSKKSKIIHMEIPFIFDKLILLH